MTLSIMERAARKRVVKQKRIAMLCNRLDRQVGYAEKYRSGIIREAYLRKAEATREQLKEIDH